MATVYILYNSNSLWQHNYHTISAPAMSSFTGDGKIIFYNYYAVEFLIKM